MEHQNTSFVLPSDSVSALFDSYQTLADAIRIATDCIRSDDVATYPVFIPDHGESHLGNENNAALRELAIKSMMGLQTGWETEKRVPSGILCASPDTVKAISALNTAKQAFKDTVLKIRAQPNGAAMKAKRISKLIEREIKEKGYRNAKLKDAMASVGIGSLDLKRCYSKIRIMPPNLQSISWTWATTHGSALKLSVEEASALIDNLPDTKSEAKVVAHDLLSRCEPNESLVRIVPQKNNQLRANYTFLEAGKLIRKPCTISGIVVAQQTEMPKKLWRPNPDTLDYVPERLDRDRTIQADPFIEILRLHRYVRN